MGFKKSLQDFDVVYKCAILSDETLITLEPVKIKQLEEKYVNVRQ